MLKIMGFKVNIAVLSLSVPMLFIANTVLSQSYNDAYMAKGSFVEEPFTPNKPASQPVDRVEVLDNRYVVELSRVNRGGQDIDLSGEPRLVIRGNESAQTTNVDPGLSVGKPLNINNKTDHKDGPSGAAGSLAGQEGAKDDGGSVVLAANMARNSSNALQTGQATPPTQAKKEPEITLDSMKEIIKERVNYSTDGQTLKDIAQALMPGAWGIKTDFHKTTDLESRFYRFDTTKSRGQAMVDLLSLPRDVSLGVRYLWDYVDEEGKPAPYLIIFEE